MTKVSPRDQALGAMYEARMERGEFDYVELDRAIARGRSQRPDLALSGRCGLCDVCLDTEET